MNDNCKYSTLRATEKIMYLRHLALLAAVVTLAACTDIDIANEPPIAEAEVLTPNGPLGYIELNGATASVQLSAAGSEDPDGRIVSWYWRRTDITNAQRFGLNDAGVVADHAEPGEGQTITLELAQGSYRFSVWVTDDDGAVGAPASVTLQVGPLYMADATCLENYPQPVMACAQCICAPSDAEPAGCLDAYRLCFENPDAEFSRLCAELVTCAINNSCSGAGCLGPCMNEINAASTYNGGTAIADCSGGDPAVNPCAASSQGLAVCTPMSCGSVCPAPTNT